MEAENKTRPGIHPKFSMEIFSEDEKAILNRLKNECYITRGSAIKFGTSEYRYFLMKPTQIFSEMFNIEREIVCIFSEYQTFEPRVLDAFDTARGRSQEMRTENVCCVLISNDSQIELKIEDLLKTDPEQPVVIPFVYTELQCNFDSFIIRNRFRKHFYTRDLFSFLSPLKKDLYFFGRSALVHELVNRHRSGEHAGLFGLRKSGKTSIIYAVERLMKLNNESYVSIDCEIPSIHKLRWFELLHKIVQLYHSAKQSNIKVHSLSDYTEKTAADLFIEDILKIYESKKRSSSLIIFDEIERISPNTGSSSHWSNGDDFIYFWQTMRGFYQRNPQIITYLLVGTNPSSVEQPILGNHENPIFSSIPAQYIPSFTLDQVREMTKKLGKYMGLKFDELLFGKMTEDFGGHPFIIRLFCSQLNKLAHGDRPITIDKALYEKCKAEFITSSSEFLDMITKILQEWYPDEYDMLNFLANNDVDTFNHFASENTNYTKHLIGYGLIQCGKNGYYFNIESIKTYISKRHKYERINLTYEEKLQEITIRRNKIEKSLRKIIKNALRMNYGTNAHDKVISSIPENRREKLEKNIDILLDKDNSPLYLLDLINIISREWSILMNIFFLEKDQIIHILKDVNSIGRPDAHAKGINNDDFLQIRLHFKRLEEIFQKWE